MATAEIDCPERELLVPTRCEVLPAHPSDRRATARALYTAPATLQLGRRRVDVETVDISPSGAQVVALEELQVGRGVHLHCELPSRTGKTEVDVSAVVRWCDPVTSWDMVLGRQCYRHGLEFWGVSATQEAEILRSIFFLETSRRTAR